MTTRSSGPWMPALGFSLALSALLVTLAPSPGQAQSARFDEFDVTSPKAGEMAPDFALMTMDNEPFDLLEVAADKPVVMEFGSFT